jgi:hypothetical protein
MTFIEGSAEQGTVRLAAEYRGARPAYHINSFTASYQSTIETLQRLAPGFSVSYQPTPAPPVSSMIRSELIQHELRFKSTLSIEAALQDDLGIRTAAASA